MTQAFQDALAAFNTQLSQVVVKRDELNTQYTANGEIDTQTLMLARALGKEVGDLVASIALIGIQAGAGFGQTE